MGETALAQLDRLQTALAKAKDIQEVAKIRTSIEMIAKSLAPRYVVPRFKAARGLVQACAKHGEFWNGLDSKRPEGRPPNNSHKSESFIDVTAAGFKHPMDARRCAKIAELDPQDLEAYFDACREESRFPSLGGAYEVWKELNPNDEAEPPIWLDSDLVLGDFREVDLPANSIDLLLTDPPYEEAALELYEGLSKKAEEWLRPGGWCAVYSGHWMLPKVLAALSKHLSYFWTIAIQHGGDYPYMRKHHIRVAWKPVLMFYKPPLSIIWGSLEDRIVGTQEKSYHPWQQSLAEAEKIVSAFSQPGGLVLDVMCGSGTALVAAKQNGRRFIGIDTDEEALNSARSRLDS